MTRHSSKFKISKRRRTRDDENKYEKIIETLLTQCKNYQEIIKEQQSMMFMFMQQPGSVNRDIILNNIHQNNHHLQQLQQQEHQTQHLPQPIHQQQQQLQEQQLFSQPIISSGVASTQQQVQQVATRQEEELGQYLTPAASEQDPISDKTDIDNDLTALLEGDGLLHDNLLYNPQTDIGSITPFKNHNEQHLTPSYYSSGGESLTTPKVDHPRHSTTSNISQNVVKNLADSFKSPTKPQINVQILPGSASGGLKNNKAKIIQRMNISKFLRQVHSDSGRQPGQGSATQ